MELLKQKQELVELLGVHFEKFQMIPPLAARILAFLIVDNRNEGVTFEELVNEIQASKSSISTNVNLLLKRENIYYCTKTGDRKKYFKVSPLSYRLKYLLENIENEISIVNRLSEFKIAQAKTAQDQTKIQNGITYKEHLVKMKELLLDTTNKLIQIENNSN